MPEDPNLIFHTAIIGAGASGLFCAGSFDAPKIVLDANETAARKVAISGGGKCNFSNRFLTAAQYESQHPHFCKSALAAFKPTDFITLLDEQHIPWEERSDGRLFAKRADDIVRFLVRRAKQHHTTLSLGNRVLNVQKKDDTFLLATSAGNIRAKHVVLACGGLSFPSLGASSFGFQLARQWGLKIVPPRPVLCGLRFPKPLRDSFCALCGNSLPVTIRQGKHSFQDQLLFTHEGISGPAVLKLSLFWQDQNEVEIDFLPHERATEIFSRHKNSSKTFASVLADYLPGKIAKILLAGVDVPLSNATRAQLQTAAQRLHRFCFTPEGTSGYTKAEATAGGIDTGELNASTLQVKRLPGVFVTGELVDVTGNLGGFNLHWAWASAFIAAQALKQCP